MGFITSFLLLSLFGFLSHRLYHKWGLAKAHRGWLFYYCFFINAAFITIDVLIYHGIFDGLIATLNLVPWVEIQNGRDYMWNSFKLLGLDYGIDYTQPALDHIAFILFFSYPMWFVFFKNGSIIIFGGNKPHEQGLWYVLGPTKKPKHEEKLAHIPKET